MFSTDFIFRQQENLVDNQKCQAGFRPLCNKILLHIGLKVRDMCLSPSLVTSINFLGEVIQARVSKVVADHESLLTQ